MQIKLKSFLFSNNQKCNRAAQKLNLFTTLAKLWNYDLRNLFSKKCSCSEQLYSRCYKEMTLMRGLEKKNPQWIILFFFDHLPRSSCPGIFWTTRWSYVMKRIKQPLQGNSRGTIMPTYLYSSPLQLPYPQLSYFRSNAILNWVPKTRVKLFFPQLRSFFPPVTLFYSVTGGKIDRIA